MSTGKDKSSLRFEELDALRGIAAISVVLFHFTMGRPEAALGFKLGTTGVDLFFMISGFVISFSISNVSSGRQFVVNRISRLYPTYWTVVSFTFVIISAYALYKHEQIPWITYLANLTMFQFFLDVPNLDEPYWTMAVEMLFYLFILIMYVTRLLRAIVVVGAAILAIIVFLAQFYAVSWVKQLFLAVPLLEFFPLFFAGILFYHIKCKTKSYHPALYHSLVLFCISAQISLFEIAGRSRSFISQTEYMFMIGVYYGLFMLFVFGRLRFMANWPLLFLGKISFALYLIHQYLILGHVLPFLTNRLGLNFWVVSMTVALPMVIALAAAITFLIEIPLGSKMKQFLSTSGVVHSPNSPR